MENIYIKPPPRSPKEEVWKIIFHFKRMILGSILILQGVPHLPLHSLQLKAVPILRNICQNVLKLPTRICGSAKTYTPRKTNMEPENEPLEEEIPIRNHHFQVPSWFSGG